MNGNQGRGLLICATLILSIGGLLTPSENTAESSRGTENQRMCTRASVGVWVGACDDFVISFRYPGWCKARLSPEIEKQVTNHWQ
jgi:hypothetical protein